MAFDLDGCLRRVSTSTGRYAALRLGGLQRHQHLPFDPQSIGATLTGGNLGVATTQLGSTRRMQFSLRYDF